LAEIALPRVGLTRVVLAIVLPALFITRRTLAAAFRGFAGLGLLFAFTALDRSPLVLKVDIVAGDELIAPDDFRKRPLGLHGSHQPEIVFGVLKVVFRQDPVARGLGVARQLLILFVNVLGGAPHLHALGAVGIEGAIGVVLRLAPTAATAATPLRLRLRWRFIPLKSLMCLTCLPREGAVIVQTPMASFRILVPSPTL